MACKLTTGVTGIANTCARRQGGIKRLLLASKEAILSVTKNTCGTVISDIELNNLTNNPTGGDDDHKFYEFLLKDKTAGFTGTETYNEEEDSLTFTPSITGRFIADDQASMCAIRDLQGKPLVALFQENGENGRWEIAGIGGGVTRGVFLTELVRNTGVALNETTEKLPGFTITSVLDEPTRYVDAGSVATTDALITDLLA